jgi:hypothetical protein
MSCADNPEQENQQHDQADRTDPFHQILRQKDPFTQSIPEAESNLQNLICAAHITTKPMLQQNVRKSVDTTHR